MVATCGSPHQIFLENDRNGGQERARRDHTLTSHDLSEQPPSNACVNLSFRAVWFQQNIIKDMVGLIHAECQSKSKQ